VSRKFAYQQTHKARAVLDDAFLSAAPDHEVLFELAVTKAWLHQVIVGQTLICRSSYRGVVEFLRDLLGVPVSLGCVHDVHEAATRQASAINHDQDLSSIRGGLHDEIFQGATPVLAGVDAQSTYCYLLAAERHRDADTWGVHLLDAAAQGLDPDYTIAETGQGLRAGQRTACGDTPCNGNVFHIQRQCEGLANTLSRLATGATSRRKTLQARVARAGQSAPDHELAAQLALARQTEAQASWLARDIRTLVHWLRHDVLALAGPDLATRRELFDFLVTELAARDPEDTLVHTDEYAIYARLSSWSYEHKTVCHGRGEYARDEDGGGFCEVDVNTMEGFWSLLRSWLRPHRGISQDKLPLYLGFFQTMHNARRRGKALLGALITALLS